MSKSNVLQWPHIDETRSDAPPLIPPGEYELEYLRYYVANIHGGPKVAVWFRIVRMGEYFQAQIARYYNVQGINRRARTFKAGWHSDLIREYIAVFGERPDRRDRVPIMRYKGICLLGRVYTVKRNRKRRDLPGAAYYSVVGELLSRKET